MQKRDICESFKFPVGVGEGDGFSWGGGEGRGEKAYNCNWITIKIEKKKPFHFLLNEIWLFKKKSHTIWIVCDFGFSNTIINQQMHQCRSQQFQQDTKGAFPQWFSKAACVSVSFTNRNKVNKCSHLVGLWMLPSNWFSNTANQGAKNYIIKHVIT